jgi:hypothetical protein
MCQSNILQGILCLLPSAPKAPGPPLKLSVGSLMRVNGTVWGELSWEPPVSDLPIQRYKVFWSRQLQGAASSLISVLVNHQTVPRVKNVFSLYESVHYLNCCFHFSGLYSMPMEYNENSSHGLVDCYAV